MVERPSINVRDPQCRIGFDLVSDKNNSGSEIHHYINYGILIIYFQVFEVDLRFDTTNGTLNPTQRRTGPLIISDVEYIDKRTS